MYLYFFIFNLFNREEKNTFFPSFEEKPVHSFVILICDSRAFCSLCKKDLNTAEIYGPEKTKAEHVQGLQASSELVSSISEDEITFD